MSRLITVPSVLSEWLADRRAFARSIQAARCRALYVVGSSLDVRGLDGGPLRVPGLERIEVGLCTPSDRQSLVRLAASARQAGIRFSANHVLLGEDSSHDHFRGGLPSFDETLRSIQALRDEAGITTTVTMPLWPETVPQSFGLWYRLVRDGIAHVATLGRLSEYDPARRLMAMELLENMAHHPTTPSRQQFAYEHMRRGLEDASGFGKAEHPQIAGDGADQDAVRTALVDGLISPGVDRLPFRWKVGRFLEGRKIDKGVLLLRGLALLGSLSIVRKQEGRSGRSRPGERRALVVGWYGTETAGDKAILGGLVQGLRQDRPALQVTVASMLPFYTRQTIEQLELAPGVDVVPLDFRILDGLMPSLDLVLVGGGPLMDLVELFDLLRVFVMAQQAGVKRVIAGCGIGPARWPFTPAVIKEMVGRSDEVVLRDQASLALLQSWGVGTTHVQAGRDPALAYVSQLAPMGTPRVSAPVLGMAVREWPWKFGRFLGRREFDRKSRELIGLWAALADWFIETFAGRVSLIPMHTLHIGGDDRWLQADVRGRMKRPERTIPHIGSYSPADTAGFLGGCDLVIAMRYHSVLFAAIQGTPFLAIDYTHGGKIGSFMKEIGMSEWLLNLEDIGIEELQNACTKLWHERSVVRQRLGALRGGLVQASLLAGQVAARQLPPRGTG